MEMPLAPCLISTSAVEMIGEMWGWTKDTLAPYWRRNENKEENNNQELAVSDP